MSSSLARSIVTAAILPVAVTALALLPACGGDDNMDSPATGSGGAASSIKISAADRKEGETLFTTLCVTCHGTSGQGDGPGSAALDPKPRNYTDKAWQASVTDDYLRKIIVLGGAGVGKSPMMPANPQLRDKQGVVQALVERIRTFGK